ncbi:MAG: ATP-binding protein [Pseudomonadota bacterium]
MGARSGSPVITDDREHGWRAVLGPRVWLLVWIPILVIGLGHYSTDASSTWVHDILRRTYYLPILFAAFLLGLRGGLLAPVVVIVSYAPHAFLHEHVLHVDPARNLEKALELVLYLVVGAVAGQLTDRERQRRRALEQALDTQRRLQHQLVRAGRLSALGEVVAGIAHEIKNPLHALRGTAEILDPLIPHDIEERRMWELHCSELDRLSTVAERFLSFARPSAANTDTILDLREVVRRTQELATAQARQQQISLDLELGELPALVRGDRDQLAQIGLNIVLNALQALGDGPGRLLLAVDPLVDRSEARVVLRIENDGPALDPLQIEHLFDPFTSGHDEGTGLGLSISARLAEAHGGYIEAANAGLGVRFSLYLPRATEGVPAP